MEGIRKPGSTTTIFWPRGGPTPLFESIHFAETRIGRLGETRDPFPGTQGRVIELPIRYAR